MRWLIDGYNLIRGDADLRVHEAESLEAGRRALLRLVGAAARASGDAFTVVFDGSRAPGGGGAPGRVEVVFSRGPETADAVLGRLACRWREAAVVVSSDREVQRVARRAGSTAVTAERFLAALAGDARADAGTLDDERRVGSPRAKRGNPRRLSQDERAARRALARLRPR
jgi:predicted RNA-binding protein with PIN domain